ncbi:hypothetical protein BC938DRAFT_475330 [Jimgerdemannia flammicorona]|uniref:Tetratricopeptide repeat-domain-containing protein n=1 Tax=Jimgerdemannia flammicorona TaxID=994334 RepID=A0A433PWE8_9FUNG|nr:hypothetical protein BC938DRAFT_475330 [Jimgerdemannia flammicorona]
MTVSISGDEVPENRTSLNNLALLYASQGEYDKVELLYEWALAISEKVLGSEHPDTTSSLNNRAELYDRLGEYDKRSRCSKGRWRSVRKC